jgi:hypothetical protein
VDTFHHYLDRFRSTDNAAMTLVSEGEHPRDKKLGADDLAAYTTVASLILNLDEAVTKE